MTTRITVLPLENQREMRPNCTVSFSAGVSGNPKGYCLWLRSTIPFLCMLTANQKTGMFLHSFRQDQHMNWAKFLPWTEYALNSLRCSPTGLTQFHCVFAYQLLLFPWIACSAGIAAVDDWFWRAEEVLSTPDWIKEAVRWQKEQAVIKLNKPIRFIVTSGLYTV